MKNLHNRPVDSAACSRRLGTIADTLYAIGGKWKLPIIVAMTHGITRFNALQREVNGISAKMLASELKDMELNGFLERTVDAGPPVVVEYQLTEYSRSLRPVLNALYDWGATHRLEIKKQFREAAKNA